MSPDETIQKPKGIKIGDVPFNAFDKMNAGDVQAWLKEQFQDPLGDYCASSVDIGNVIDWTLNSFSEFRTEVKTCFADAVAASFDELLRQPEEWQPIQRHGHAEKMFAFTESIGEHLSVQDKVKLQNKLLPLLDGPDVPLDSKYRALNLLANIFGYSASEDFWLKQHKQLPEGALLVFAGLGIEHPQAAFDFLAEQPWDFEGIGGFILSCTLLRIKEAHGQEVATEGIKTLQAAHPEAKNQIREMMREAERIMNRQGRG